MIQKGFNKITQTYFCLLIQCKQLQYFIDLFIVFSCTCTLYDCNQNYSIQKVNNPTWQISDFKSLDECLRLIVPDMNITIVQTCQHPWLSGMYINTLNTVWTSWELTLLKESKLLAYKICWSKLHSLWNHMTGRSKAWSLNSTPRLKNAEVSSSLWPFDQHQISCCNINA